jgi:hypothetical protein
MIELSSTGREIAKGAGLLVSHLSAVVLGVVLMIIGSALGVSLVLLPIGIPVGLIGLGLFLWGLFGWASDKTKPGQP